MKKFIISAIAMIMSLAAAAGEYSLATLILTPREGQAVEIEFRDEPIATFEGEDLVLTLADASRMVFNMADVSSLTFKSEDFSKVEQTVADAAVSRVKFSVSASAVTAEGLKAGERASLYDISGRLMTTTVADESGRAVLSTENLPSGVYIVVLADFSFKFIK